MSAELRPWRSGCLGNGSGARGEEGEIARCGNMLAPGALAFQAACWPASAGHSVYDRAHGRPITEHRRPGLVVIEDWKSAPKKVRDSERQDAAGSGAQLDLHWDADRVLFAFRPRGEAAARRPG